MIITSASTLERYLHDRHGLSLSGPVHAVGSNSSHATSGINGRKISAVNVIVATDNLDRDFRLTFAIS